MKYSRPNPLAWIDDELNRLESIDLRRRLEHRDARQADQPAASKDGTIQFGSNDYLGLAADPRLASAAASAALAAGWGSGASPVVSGRSPWHARLERRLAEFAGTEAALVFSSGYAANAGTIAALAGRGDAIYSDQKNHASIIDGCRLSRADIHVYPHRDWRALAALVERPGQYRRRLIVTESLFSMDGDLAPLVEIAELAARADAMLLVDEAHAIGVLGEKGRGLCEALEIEEYVAVRIGTLSKALGSSGGFVCGSQALVDWLVNRARPYVFSTAAPAAHCAAALAALDIVRDEPRRREQLAHSAAGVRGALRGVGWNLGSSESHIIPVIVGSAAQAVRLSERLRERGLLVPAIRPPSVPEGASLVRISVSCSHTPAMLERLTTALVELRSQLAKSRA